MTKVGPDETDLNCILINAILKYPVNRFYKKSDEKTAYHLLSSPLHMLCFYC